MSGTINELIRRAFKAGKAGDRISAKKLLSQVVEQDPQNVRAWYLLSQVVDNEKQAVFCLEKALEADPDNHRVAERLQQIKMKRGEPLAALEPQQQPAEEKRNPILW